jgi:hypothetical protein
MGALRNHQVEISEQPETEVIYLVIPASSQSIASPTFKPYTIAERVGLLSENIQLATHRLSNHASAAVVALVAVTVVGYGLYTFKSALGINIFKAQGLESFVPLPGYNR